jgi:hypothetical protein
LFTKQRKLLFAIYAKNYLNLTTTLRFIKESTIIANPSIVLLKDAKEHLTQRVILMHI